MADKSVDKEKLLELRKRLLQKKIAHMESIIAKHKTAKPSSNSLMLHQSEKNCGLKVTTLHSRNISVNKKKSPVNKYVNNFIPSNCNRNVVYQNMKTQQKSDQQISSTACMPSRKCNFNTIRKRDAVPLYCSVGSRKIESHKDLIKDLTTAIQDLRKAKEFSEMSVAQKMIQTSLVKNSTLTEKLKETEDLKALFLKSSFDKNTEKDIKMKTKEFSKINVVQRMTLTSMVKNSSVIEDLKQLENRKAAFQKQTFDKNTEIGMKMKGKEFSVAGNIQKMIPTSLANNSVVNKGKKVDNRKAIFQNTAFDKNTGKSMDRKLVGKSHLVSNQFLSIPEFCRFNKNAYFSKTKINKNNDKSRDMSELSSYNVPCCKPDTNTVAGVKKNSSKEINSSLFSKNAFNTQIFKKVNYNVNLRDEHLTKLLKEKNFAKCRNVSQWENAVLKSKKKNISKYKVVNKKVGKNPHIKEKNIYFKTNKNENISKKAFYKVSACSSPLPIKRPVLKTKYKTDSKLVLHKDVRKMDCLNMKVKSTIDKKQDDLYDLLKDSPEIERLEKELLAENSELLMCDVSTTPRISTEIIENITTNTRKRKVLSSKYKIINKDNQTGKQKHLLVKNVNRPNKIIRSKFSLIKTHSASKCNYSPKFRNVVLVKRLFKSKRVIVNKNSPVRQRAKMIKSKYLSRKKITTQNHKMYKYSPRFLGSPLLNKFKLEKKVSAKRFPIYQSRRYPSHVNGQNFKPYNKKGHFRKVSLNKINKGMQFNAKLAVRNNGVKRMVSLPSTNHIASRVLHRSINRALTASAKKLTKVNTYCMFYNRFGRCNKGAICTFIHDPSKIAVCTRFLRGTCKIEGCPFSHEKCPGKIAICSFFLLGACEKDDCPYRHEYLAPDAQLCKAFVQGYCPTGKECKKAHVLVCPKYIQGTCGEGDKCPFPHPPSKVKKHVGKELEIVTENKSEDLLETVARYFEHSKSNSSVDHFCVPGNANIVLPHKKKLEEQPSFIPLFNNKMS